MTESIAERNIDGWLAALASSDPTPGGGTAAALMAAQGAALISMVAELTVGRPNYTEHEDTMRQALTAATELRRRALAAADADAFEAVISAYRLPKTTDAEKTARSAAIQAATFAAGRAPLEVAALAADVIELAHRIEPGANVNVLSDVAVAVQCARAALDAAAPAGRRTTGWRPCHSCRHRRTVGAGPASGRRRRRTSGTRPRCRRGRRPPGPADRRRTPPRMWSTPGCSTLRAKAWARSRSRPESRRPRYRGDGTPST